MSGVIRPNFYTVLRHLAFARHWLDKAEGEFRRAETDRGELTLSLAEAEMREAWEASRRVRSSSLDLLAGAARLLKRGEDRLGVRGRWVKAGILVAAVLSVALAFGARPAKAPVQSVVITRATESPRVTPASTPVPATETPAAMVTDPVRPTGGEIRDEKAEVETEAVTVVNAGAVEAPAPETLPVQTTAVERPAPAEASVRPAVEQVKAVAGPATVTAAVLPPSEFHVKEGVARTARPSPVSQAPAATQPSAPVETAGPATEGAGVAVDLIELVQVAQQSLYRE